MKEGVIVYSWTPFTNAGKYEKHRVIKDGKKYATIQKVTNEFPPPRPFNVEKRCYKGRDCFIHDNAHRYFRRSAFVYTETKSATKEITADILYDELVKDIIQSATDLSVVNKHRKPL